MVRITLSRWGLIRECYFNQLRPSAKAGLYVFRSSSAPGVLLRSWDGSDDVLSFGGQALSLFEAVAIKQREVACPSLLHAANAGAPLAIAVQS
jgi:hypothetical protein